MLPALLILLGMVSVHGADAPGDIHFQREGVEATGGSFPPAIFPHWIHRINYRCDACHDSLFRMEQGSTEITMGGFRRGAGSCRGSAPGHPERA